MKNAEMLASMWVVRVVLKKAISAPFLAPKKLDRL